MNMKKTFVLLFAICAWLYVSAQSNEPELENGYYVYKYVQQAEGVSQNELYLRVHTFLSDWAGPNSNSKCNIDFDDKESSTIITKGTYFLRYEKENFMYGWNIFADFIVTIKCKDGRFQVITKVPTMSFWWTAGTEPLQTIPFNELYPTYTHKGPYRLKKYSDKYVIHMPMCVKKISNMIVDGVMTASDNDDF